jgi:hypothetical protein
VQHVLTIGMAGRGDEQRRSVESEGEGRDQRMHDGSPEKFEDSEEFASLLELSKPTFVDEIMMSESSALEAGKSIANSLWDKKIKQEDVAKISFKKPLDTKEIPGLDDEFERRLNRKDMIGKKKEVERIDKRLKSALHMYNAQLEIAAMTTYLAKDISMEERERITARLVEAQKAAFLVNKKLLEDLVKDKRLIAREAAGMRNAKEQVTRTATTEEDKKELKEKKEEAEKRDVHQIAVASMGPRSTVTLSTGYRNANYFGYGRSDSWTRGRNQSRGYQSSGWGGGRASQTSSPAGGR